MPHIHTLTLDCGLTLLVEPIPGVRSVGLSWLVPAGTARDPAGRVGMSAMWSELLNRGAGELDSRAQADAFDRLGVSRGCEPETFGHVISATMLGARVGEALGLIVEMALRPRMEAEAVAAARDLCLQAIESLADDPQARVMQVLRERHAPPPINRSTLGETAGIEAIGAEEVLPAWRERAVPVGSAIGLAGEVDPAEAGRLLDRLLRGWSGKAAEVAWGEPEARGYHHQTDKTNQAHIAVAWDAPSEGDAACWPERVVGAVLSGGMSCRLFSEVREKRALCYSVYASYAADARYGRGVAYVGTTPQRAQESLEVLWSELDRINRPEGRVTPEEFRRAVVGMKSRLVMSGESTSARAAALVRDWRKLGRARTLDELAARVDAVTLDQVNEHLASRNYGRTTIVTLGPEPLTPPAGGK